MGFLILPIAAFVPLIVGFVWYNPKVVGAAWQREAGLSTEQLQADFNPVKMFGTAYVLSLFLALAIWRVVVHQAHVESVFAGFEDMADPNSAHSKYLAAFMSEYGSLFRTFKHGVFHGIIEAIFVALPIIGINALFERKSLRYVMIHVGYWAITIGIMGGLICQFI